MDGNRDIFLSKEGKKVMTNMPKRALQLHALSIWLTDWLPHDCGRMIWLTYWNTDPPEQRILFEKLRFGCGESRHIIEAPGHLFRNSTEEDHAMMAGLIFLIMAFNWTGYVVAEKFDGYIYLGDEYIVFSCDNDEKETEASQLISAFKLDVITDVKQA